MTLQRRYDVHAGFSGESLTLAFVVQKFQKFQKLQKMTSCDVT